MMPTPTSLVLADHLFEVCLPVIVGEFFARLDGAPGINKNSLTIQYGFAVGFAGVIDVASEVRTSRSIDGELRLCEIEEIVTTLFFRCFIGDDLAPVLNHKLPALDGRLGKKTEPG